MPVFIDQTGRPVQLDAFPQRIISLVPSQTELLSDLGLNHEVAGITKFCIHPKEWFQHKPRVGGTKQLNLQTIHELKPDLVIANKEENVKEQVEALMTRYPVWISDVNNLADACDMIGQVGAMTNRVEIARDIVQSIQEQFLTLAPPAQRLRTAYLIWQKPYMTVGGDTFIHAMLDAAGFENIFSDKKRYPEITIPDLVTANCELLLLSSEPFPFTQRHADELQAFLPGVKIVLADGELFSWYGSRLIKAPAYFNQLLSACT